MVILERSPRCDQAVTGTTTVDSNAATLFSIAPLGALLFALLGASRLGLLFALLVFSALAYAASGR
jgi:hypothetical protein